MRRFVDLFCGVGGIRLGMESAGFKCVFSCDMDKECQLVYQENFGELPWGDITKIDAKDVPNHDILCAGFPCQPFSISGKQQGFADIRGNLFFEIIRIAKHHKPPIMLLENVKNIIKHDSGRTLEVILNSLNEIGYDVFFDVYAASDYNVPQKRERVFFVCFRKDFGIKTFEKPKKIKLKKHLEDILLPPEEVQEFIVNRDDIIWKPNVVEYYTDMPLRLGIVGKGGQGERIYSTKGTAITLSAYGGGAGAKTGLYKVGNAIRKLTPRECARLDGFPESFKIPKNKNIAYKQFGNSVVVDVVQRIMLQIIAKHPEIIFRRTRQNSSPT